MVDNMTRVGFSEGRSAQSAFQRLRNFARAIRACPSDLYMILRIFMDEAGTHVGNHRMVIGSVVGTLDQWDRFDVRFSALKSAMGLQSVHGTDMKKVAVEKGWTPRDLEFFWEQAFSCFQDELGFGAFASLREADYEREYSDGLKFSVVKKPTAYGVCFRFCLDVLFGNVVRASGESLERAHIVFEKPSEHSGELSEQFELFRAHQLPPKYRETFTFTLDPKGSAFLEMADLVSHVFYQTEKWSLTGALTHMPPARGMENGRGIVYVHHVTANDLRGLKRKHLRVDRALDEQRRKRKN